jgi:hypothetical protein
MAKTVSLIDKLEADLGWRKKEVTNLLLLENEHNQLLILKSTLLLLYSHWEGFVKNASKAYLDHVSNKKINIDDLTDNFKAITLKGLIKEVEKSSDTLTLSNELKFISKINGNTSKPFTVKKGFSEQEKDKSIINTKDNLSLNVFKSILHIVGIDYDDSIDTKSKFIDEKLLESRNKVAHGTKIEKEDAQFDLSLEDLKEVKDVIFFLMDCLSDDLIYFAYSEFYLSINTGLTKEYLKTRTDRMRHYLP